MMKKKAKEKAKRAVARCVALVIDFKRGVFTRLWPAPKPRA